MQTALVFSRFERFWHWSQALLIIGLMITGFEIHGTYQWLGFEQASSLHKTMAWTLIVLWVFAIFWHLTTGQWRQYVPTGQNLLGQMSQDRNNQHTKSQKPIEFKKIHSLSVKPTG